MTVLCLYQGNDGASHGGGGTAGRGSGTPFSTPNDLLFPLGARFSPYCCHFVQQFFHHFHAHDPLPCFAEKPSMP
jgi:hypothetical protein